ncbi:MAG: alpha/beta hydrolase-fold protein [Nannocystaceae bacterium]
MRPSLRRAVALPRIAVLVSAALSLACASNLPPSPPPPLEGEREIAIGTQLPIDSRILGDRRSLSVSLPWGYDQRKDRFPVLYLIDGGPEQDFVPVAGFAALASLSGQYREFIVVGIETLDRRYELTTPSEVAFDRQALPRNGGADDFRRYIREEVQPLIESRYRTTGERAVLGESLAGLFIVDTFLRAPESFDMYIAVSPSLWWREAQLARSAGERLRAGFPADRSLYLASADEADIIAGIEPLVAALRSHAPRSLRWWYEPMPDEHHNTIYHPATLRALRLLFARDAER